MRGGERERDSFFGLIPSPAIMRFRVSVYGARARKGKLEGALIKRKKSGSRYGFYTNNRTLSILTNSVQPLRSLNLPLREGPRLNLNLYSLFAFLWTNSLFITKSLLYLKVVFLNWESRIIFTPCHIQTVHLNDHYYMKFYLMNK